MPRREWREPTVQRLIEGRPGKTPEEAIEEYAAELRACAEQDRFPIDTALIASMHGVRRRCEPFDFAGRIYAEPNGQLVMDINEDDPPPRRRFTEAHELIHTAFPGFKSERRYRSDSSSERNAENREEEYLCDFGAAALLMPAELVDGVYTVGGGLADVERLSADAEVSIEAAANRLVQLADEPAAVICLIRSHKPADRPRLRSGEAVPRQLRVRYASARHMNLYVPKFKGADPTSVFARAEGSSGVEAETAELPGAATSGLFRIEAKLYGEGPLARVIAIARPTA